MKNRVLILDDDPSVIRYLSRILGQEFDLGSYLNGNQALEALRIEPFDAVVSDMDVGDMTGVEFYREAIKIRPELTKRFVFHTGSPNPPQVEVPLLEKPASASTLCNMVRALVA